MYGQNTFGIPTEQKAECKITKFPITHYLEKIQTIVQKEEDDFKFLAAFIQVIMKAVSDI